jgi:RHH-type transcriptional regulator, proline utilization regulon repressor / proline dehydrogenase / delta 1-pyrroline-5-carboxylate dehydrogenase
MASPPCLPGYTGELNELLHAQGRGPFVCISPWNFPLAIFLGQVAAALVTGNTVLAKPAEQTSLVAHLAVKLAHQAGIPPRCCNCCPATAPPWARPG